MTAKETSNCDQASATLIDLWMGMFNRMLDQGMQRDEALQVLLAWIKGTCRPVGESK